RGVATRRGPPRNPGDDCRRSWHASGFSRRGPMNRWARVSLLVLFACACHHEYGQPPAPPETREMVALLPDPETNTVGHAIVSSLQGGTVELTEQRTTTRIVNGQTPSDPFTLSEDEVQRLF